VRYLNSKYGRVIRCLAMGLRLLATAVWAADTVLIDSGGGTTQTSGGQPYWNNVTATFGAASGNSLPNLASTGNSPTGILLEIVSPFHASPNQNGTTSNAGVSEQILSDNDNVQTVKAR
jgi:hypothetical protein